MIALKSNTVRTWFGADIRTKLCEMVQIARGMCSGWSKHDSRPPNPPTITREDW